MHITGNAISSGTWEGDLSYKAELVPHQMTVGASINVPSGATVTKDGTTIPVGGTVNVGDTIKVSGVSDASVKAHSSIHADGERHDIDYDVPLEQHDGNSVTFVVPRDPVTVEPKS